MKLMPNKTNDGGVEYPIKQHRSIYNNFKNTPTDNHLNT